jgi:uncharacterized protein
MQSKKLTWFLILTFGIAWPLFLLPALIGAPGSPERQTAMLVGWSLAMWAPGVAAIVVTRFIAREEQLVLNLRRFGPKAAYLWAWLLPIFLALVAGLFTWLLGAGRLDLTFTAIRSALPQTDGAPALTPGLMVAMQVLAAFTIGPLFNVLFAMGEELGWRGFLLPQLESLGTWRAILISNVIWGIWHAPAILQGHNYPGRPVLGLFMMVVFCILLGTILSWLYFQTRSSWAPALAHGSVNASAGLPLLFLVDVDIVIGGTLVSAIGWIGMILFIGWLVGSGRLPRFSELFHRTSLIDHALHGQGRESALRDVTGP